MSELSIRMITGCSDRLTSQRRRRLRPSWIPAVLVLGLFYGCQSTPRAGDSDRLLREARLHLEQNNYDYALIKTDAYLQQPWGDKPEEDLALSMAAYASLKMGRTTQSLEYVGALRERFPDSRYNNDQLDRLEANAEQALAAQGPRLLVLAGHQHRCTPTMCCCKSGCPAERGGGSACSAQP